MARKLVAAATLAAAALAATAPAFPALADEAWGSDQVEIYWLSEIPGFAVFEFRLKDGNGTVTEIGKMFVAGLVGTDSNRGVFQGYWATYGEAEIGCLMPIIDAEGTTTQIWGSLTIAFASPTFPSGFTAKLGDCTGPATRTLTVVPSFG